MGRPKGSPNKAKNIKFTKNGAVIKVGLEKQVDGAPWTRASGRGWINWGMRNDYPLQLSSLYFNSPTHQSCVDFRANAIIGEGIDYDAMELAGIEEIVPNYTTTWEEFLRAIATDYVIYGSYAFQIIKNKDGQTYSVYHQPMSSVRATKKDNDGVITHYFVCSDWTMVGQLTPVELPAFNFQEDEELPQGKAYLYVYNKYCPDVEYYTMPSYASAIKSIQTEIQLIRYDLRSVVNNFSASGLLEVARIDSDEERKDFIDNITTMFQGAENANSLMIQFRDNVEDKNVQFTKFDKDISHVDLFDKNNDRAVNRIVAAHRIPSKGLIGYDTESGMLGGEGNLLNVAYNLYMKNVGNMDQGAVIGTINKIFKLNGVDIQLKMKPLRFDVLQPTSIREESVDVNKDVTDGDNVEEKVVEDNTVNNNG